MHFLLRSGERSLAFARESHALLEGAQRLIERQIARLELCHQCFELSQGSLELGGAAAGDSSLLCCVSVLISRSAAMKRTLAHLSPLTVAHAGITFLA